MIEFRPGVAGMIRFASELEDALQRFPLRVVEKDGVATHYAKRLRGQ